MSGSGAKVWGKLAGGEQSLGEMADKRRLEKNTGMDGSNAPSSGPSRQYRNLSGRRGGFRGNRETKTIA